MLANASTQRKWKRYGCLLPCRVVPIDHETTSVSGRIINIGRGGILMESDYNFASGDVVRIIPYAGDSDRIRFDREIQGTVRWGQIDTESLMGLFYVGIEFDDLLPLKQVVFQQK